ncbi:MULTISPECIES: XisH family protein [Cyanophyceae]|uniref:XisH family protein n=1 Tax=Cyanophyceae TaxID=3028117 RepID=UPI00168628A3|nr:MULTISPECIES: XisH family protein [Cyanophyceae]MBD1915206.1 XisH family protein [Phormidium sp. FACHB-77]MBD2032517.1 XisH family protein [Phormidium sp. FACHB-322]MBD2050952.1 XisH family protein [Leptolyngbya sp. FACHB-60]
MPAKDIYHDAVKTALIKDGWTITQDPLSLRIGKKDLFIDLGAEKLLAAEKGLDKIAVEVKSFVGPSEIRDLENALGQFVLYENALSLIEPDRTLYLAIREAVYLDLFEAEIGKMLLERNIIKLVSFNPEQEVITRWIP